MDSVKTLNYAPKPPAAGRYLRGTYRIVIFLGAIALIVFWGPPAWRRAHQVYMEYRAARYFQPADHVSFEYSKGSATHSDKPLGYPAGTFFLHARLRPDGKKRLVELRAEVRRFNTPVSSTPCVLLEYEVLPVFESGSIFSLLQRVIFISDLGDHSCKFFAGQPDANNASHFTFVYESDGGKHTVDCWLNNNDRLVISQRP